MASDSSLEHIDEELEPIDSLLQRRLDAYRRKEASNNKSKTLRIAESGPYGLLVFGDPHLDDDGCDLDLVRRHLAITQKEAIYGICVGDYTNNWVGRLGALYADQSSTAKEAWRLVEWFVGAGRFILLVGGNHDSWSGHSDPLQWIARHAKSRYISDEARVTLKSPSGDVTLWARHDFAGKSQYHAVQGMLRSVHFGDFASDIMVGGHTHQWGHYCGERPGGGAYTALRVAAYKRFDNYAKQLNLPEVKHGAGCLLIIDPEVSGPGRVTPYWDVERGARVLALLRATR